MKAIVFYILLILVLKVSNTFGQTEECTIGIANGSVTTDGRPILFKNRDTDEIQQRLTFCSESSWNFSYIGVHSNGNLPTMGVNSAGLAVGNSKVAPDTGAYNYDNAMTSRYILANFDNIDDVTTFLDSQNIFRITGCFPFIDSRGEAIMHEVLKPRDSREPRWIWTYNTVDSKRESQNLLGIVPRANEFHKRKDGVDDLETGGRYETNRYNLVGLRDINMLNVQTIIQGNNGNNGYEVLRYGPNREKQKITRPTSQSAIVVHGVKPGEDPALTTLWVILGPANYSIAVPAWVYVGNNVPFCLKSGRMWDRAHSLYLKDNEFQTQASTIPAEKHIFNMIYEEIMPHLRINGFPPVDEISRIHNQIANDAYSLLDCLDNKRLNNKAPEISSIRTKIVGKEMLEFSVTATDSDGHLVSYEWDFGDGHISTLESPKHNYAKKGTYLVSCKVEDNENVCITSWRYLKIY